MIQPINFTYPVFQATIGSMGTSRLGPCSKLGTYSELKLRITSIISALRITNHGPSFVQYLKADTTDSFLSNQPADWLPNSIDAVIR